MRFDVTTVAELQHALDQADDGDRVVITAQLLGPEGRMFFRLRLDHEHFRLEDVSCDL